MAGNHACIYAPSLEARFLSRGRGFPGPLIILGGGIVEEVIAQFGISALLDAADYFFKSFIYRLSDVLPESPISGYNSDFADLASEYLGYLNWLFPVGACIDIMLLIVSALGTYYSGRYILKRMGVL